MDVCSTAFPVASNNDEAVRVLIALSITVDGMYKHRGCGVATWLMSGALTEEDYNEAGLGHLMAEAKAAMHNPDFQEATTKYTKGHRLWDTRTVFLLDQVCEVLSQAEEQNNAKQLEQDLGRSLGFAKDPPRHARGGLLQRRRSKSKPKLQRLRIFWQ
jgi:hypothetical protein